MIFFSTDACQGLGSLQGPLGIIASPNFPQRYPAGSDCTWSFNLQNGHARVNLTFLELQVRSLFHPNHQKTLLSNISAVYQSCLFRSSNGPKKLLLYLEKKHCSFVRFYFYSIVPCPKFFYAILKNKPKN